MRTTILVLVTLLLIALAYGSYLMLQSPPKVHHHYESTTAPTEQLVEKENNLSGIWIVNYDKITGDITSRFRADDYRPRKDGKDEVIEPRGQFVLKGRGPNGEETWQVLEIQGKTGEISHNGTGTRSAAGLGGPSTDMPSQGLLHDVTVYLYPNEDILDYDATAGGTNPATLPAPPPWSLKITMANASFDTESFRIRTEPEPKLHLTGEQIDVYMTGDYDFHGKGLKIYWDDRDRRLSLLEIAHGDFLTINHPERLGKSNALASNFGVDKFEPVLLADAGGAATEEAVHAGRHRAHTPAPTPTSRPAMSPDEQPPLYRAIFNDDVHVYQGDSEIVTAKTMFLDFLMRGGNSPTTAPTTAEAAATEPTVGPTTRGGHHLSSSEPVVATTQAASTGPSTGPSTEPVATSQPAQPPITIRWTGMLHMAPLGEQVQAGIPLGAAVVRFEGSPVVAHQPASSQPAGGGGGDASQIICSTLTYRTQDGSMTALQSRAPNADPVLLTDAKGMRVHTPQLDYSQTDGIAVLTGKGDARIPVVAATQPTTQAVSTATTQPAGAATTRPTEIMTAAWTEGCTLNFEQTRGGERVIHHADFTGDVDINHPRLKLKSQKLDLTFMPTTKHAQPTTAAALATTGATTVPAARPEGETFGGGAALSRLEASGDVHCDTLDASDRKKTIDCDSLTLQTASTSEGKLYAHKIDAYGNVHALDEDQDLHSQDLHTILGLATTRPATTGPADASDMFSGDVQLQHANANGSVHVVTKDGATATADEMIVESKDGKPTVRFLSPGGDATLIDKGSTLVGQNILLDPQNQQMAVSGPGTLHWVKTETPGSAPRVLDAQWTQNLDANFRKDLIVILGGVDTTTTDPDGTVNNARGDRATITTTQPATQPATQPSSAVAAVTPIPTTNLATSRPTSRPAGDGNLFGNKVVHTITFEDNAEVDSQLLSNTGALARRMDLQSSIIRFEQDYVADGIIKKLNVPKPGRMLVEDYRSSNPTTKESSGDHKGASAFTWDDSLTYDSSTHLAIMTGLSRTGVHVVYESKTDSAKPFDITGSRITAELVEVVPTTNPAASAPPTNPPETATHATSQPTTKPAGDHMELKQLTVDGQAVFTATDGNQIFADRVTYDPMTHIVVAMGTPHVPVVFADVQGLESITADRIDYNAELALPRFVNIHSRMRMNVPTTRHAQSQQ